LTTSRAKKVKTKYKVISKDNFIHALNYYLGSLSILDDDEHVTFFHEVKDGFEIAIERISNED
jgi:hypothetical protein